MKALSSSLVFALFSSVTGLALADGAPPAASPSASAGPCACELPAGGDYGRGVAFEVNVLWPFFPGGITEFRLMVPVVAADRRDFRGELVLGTYSDFASRVVRNDSHGKVAILAAKIGWRQFFVHGLHAELSATVGWRHEAHRPPDDVTIDALQARVWLLAGYQHEFSRTFYANVRGALGVHLYRSDAYASTEKKLVPGADANIGFRF